MQIIAHLVVSIFEDTGILSLYTFVISLVSIPMNHNFHNHAPAPTLTDRL